MGGMGLGRHFRRDANLSLDDLRELDIRRDENTRENYKELIKSDLKLLQLYKALAEKLSSKTLF
jgi:predicted glycosyltransferase involved in capsule biosynthesis